MRRLPLALVLLLFSASSNAAEATVAVAANFAAPLKALASDYQAASGHKLKVVVGSTGKLTTQIRHGAPFDLLLAADDERPTRLVEDGLAIADSRFTYALGRLVLWSKRRPELAAEGPAALKAGGFRHLAIANPELAPYGAAAREVLNRLGLWQALRPKLVRGEDIGQTFQFVATGNAELGFVALSQALQAGGRYWEVPARLHAPIRQDAVLLKRGVGNAAAEEFLAFLRSEEGRARIRGFGYDAEEAR